MPYFHAGTQFWNEDRTKGYEIIADVDKDDIINASAVKVLGDAENPKVGEILPAWFRGALQEYYAEHGRHPSPQKSVTPAHTGDET
jgi:hypothetical protein